MTTDNVNHPQHYGGEDNPYEAIKVIEAWGLGFNLGNAVKYICRAPHKGQLEDLKKARWYLDREIEKLETKPVLRREGFNIGDPVEIISDPNKGERGVIIAISDTDPKWFTVKGAMTTRTGYGPLYKVRSFEMIAYVG